jgi:uncharacterized protein DUF6338
MIPGRLPSSHRNFRTLTSQQLTNPLETAVLGAYLATKPQVRRMGERLTGPYPHESTVSAWWVLFERWPNGRNVEVICMLDDGSSVRGLFGSFNTSADDSPDRDLILQQPIFYRPLGENAKEVSLNVSAACCPARRIVSLFVAYSEQAGDLTSSQEQPGSETPQECPGSETPAASLEQSEAATTVGKQILELEQPSPLQESSGPVPRG